MPNLYKNKVVYDNTVLIDITDTTAEASDVAAGKYFYDKSGAKVEGTASSVARKQITFYDYDGTVVKSYTAAEFAELQALPANPSHSRLVAQGWNWTLRQIQDYLSDYPDGDVNVGQMYITESGATEIDIELASDTLEPWLRFGINGSAEIDWGDGSTNDTVTGTSTTDMLGTRHVYSAPGNYTISIIVNSGSIGFKYYNICSLLCDRNSTNVWTRKYLNTIRAIHLGRSSNNISQYAFQNCYSLTSITIPSGVTDIGANAFQNCKSLTYITIPSGNVTNIGNNAFQNCYSLTSITIPSGFTNIGNNTFYNCYNLTSITILSGVTNIGNTTFQNCYSLTSITIPSGVTNIGDNTFQNCYNLTSITISSGVTNIGNNVFRNCYSLTSITIPSGVTNIKNNTFYNCQRLTSITIPSGVTNIGANAFQNCQRLTSITVPSGVTNIGANAFQNCYSLTSITIPSGVTNIGNTTFQNCYSLTSITIPSGVTNIGDTTFQNCYSMLEYHFESKTPPTLSSTNVFSGISSECIIYVPKGCLEAYQIATKWSTYASKIQEEPA